MSSTRVTVFNKLCVNFLYILLQKKRNSVFWVVVFHPSQVFLISSYMRKDKVTPVHSVIRLGVYTVYCLDQVLFSSEFTLKIQTSRYVLLSIINSLEVPWYRYLCINFNGRINYRPFCRRNNVSCYICHYFHLFLFEINKYVILNSHMFYKPLKDTGLKTLNGYLGYLNLFLNKGSYKYP